MKHRLKVWGDFACFTRPEMKVERVSYDVITPSAAKAICDAILWAPDIQWNIELIQVLKPIKWMNIKRNEIASKASKNKEIYIEEERIQRSSLLLKDVAYIIQARLKTSSDDVRSKKKFNEIFKRRASKGQCFIQPYLGCREFSAHFQLLKDEKYTPIAQTKDLGWMLYEMDYKQNEITPRFFHATMKNGEILVPPKNSLLVES